MTARSDSGSGGVLVVVFAKAPRPGLVKTRLCPPLTPEQAASLYSCMLEDVLDVTAKLCRRRAWKLRVAVHPADGLAEVAAHAPPGAEFVAQAGEGLSARMSHAVAEAAAAGYERIVLRGSDSPALSPKLLEAAVEQLETSDVVIGPDVDGGYNLLGLCGAQPGLFDHAMSTASVAEDTRANALRMGLSCSALATSFDLDTADDLARLQRHLSEPANAEDTRWCRRTRAALDREAWWPAG